MFTLVYVSSATKLFARAELLELLAASRKNNEALGISGMLLYKDGNFMQVLEGEESQVRALSARISRDPRHQGMMIPLQEHCPQRAFPEWSMGFRDLESEEVRRMPGFDEFLNVDLTDSKFVEDPSRAHRLLLTFRKSM